jgi:hypothetical protein
VAFQRSVDQGRPSASTLLSRAITRPEHASPSVEAANGVEPAFTGGGGSVPAIGRLTVSPAAEVWPAGSAPLVRWLRANPDVLGELIGTTLETAPEEVPGLEAAVFAAADGTRLLAVVELGESSEGMLGSLLTRLSTARAGRAIWICGEARDEHVSALSWLNRAVDGRFYMARLRAARIGSSDAAPILELVVRNPRVADAAQDAPPASGPNGEARRAGDQAELVEPE